MSNRSINMSRGSLDSSILKSNGELKTVWSRNSQGAQIVDNFESEHKNSLQLNGNDGMELQKDLKEASSIFNSEDGGWHEEAQGELGVIFEYENDGNEANPSYEL